MSKNNTLEDLSVEEIEEASKIFHEASSTIEGIDKSWDHIEKILEEKNAK